ncbi:unnamed protein product, partial [marine sediment metagenome]
DILSLAKEFKIAGVKLLFVKEQWDDTLNGKLIAFVLGWASEFEAAQIRERTMRGIRERVKSGRLPGGRKAKLFGYVYLPGKGIGEGIRYVNKEEAHWVREIYRWFVEEGLTLNGVVYRLRSLAVKSPSGNSNWGKATVHKILTRVAYTGKTYAFTQRRVETKTHKKPVRKHKATRVIFRPPEEWVEIPNATPPIISEELFQQAEARLRRNKELASRNTKGQYLLSGYVFCSQCGRRYFGISASKTRGGIKYYYRYYYCPKNFKITSPITCPNRGWNA